MLLRERLCEMWEVGWAVRELGDCENGDGLRVCVGACGFGRGCGFGECCAERLGTWATVGCWRGVCGE